MFLKAQLLNHFKHLNPAIERIGAEAYLNVRNFKLEIRFQGRVYSFYPQFMYLDGQGGQHYTPQFRPEVSRFIGWCPYFNKRWDLGVEKLKFKEYAVKNRLQTPEYWVDPEVVVEHVLVKYNLSSFGNGMRGPYRSSKETQLKAREGEYYERFVWGKVVKIWFWDGSPVCCELSDFGSIPGDGKRSVRELVLQQFQKRDQIVMVEAFSDFLVYQGRSLDWVPALDEVQPLDFRYGSKLLFPLEVKDIDLRRDPIPGTDNQLKHIGSTLLRGIPEEIRANTVFTVDAILDKEQKLWILEMNCNPFLHPYVYPPMIESWAKDPNSPTNQVYGIPHGAPVVGAMGVH